MSVSASPARHSAYQLRYRALDQRSRALAFPCDADGHVDLDALSEAARNDYFFARAVVGGQFTRPSVQANA
jgi:hypothetical protein